jgi:hypothetical protein
VNAKTRRKLEMGAHALEFSRANPDPSAGYQTAVARLGSLMERAATSATREQDGVLARRSATVRKRELRHAMRTSHLPHIAQAAKAARREEPELAETCIIGKRATSYLGFRTASRRMEAEALAHKEVLVKYGLVEAVLADLTQSLGEFDAAVESGAQGLATHVGASAELDAIAGEVVQCVRILHGLNRYRFRAAPELLAAWISASNVVSAPRSPEPKPGEGSGGTTPVGDVRPAA